MMNFKVVMLVGEWRDSKREERKVGKYFTFRTTACLAVVSGKHRLRNIHLITQVRVVREGHMPSEKAIGDRLCKSKYR